MNDILMLSRVVAVVLMSSTVIAITAALLIMLDIRTDRKSKGDDQ